jgi:hypothetical protein
MPFDYQGARAAGYSDAEIASFLGQQAGFDTDGAIKSGYKPAEIIPFLSDRLNQQSAAKEQPTVPDQQPESAPMDIDGAPILQPASTVEAGAGRGVVNPPLAADVGRRDVSAAEAFGRGVGESGAKSAKYLAAAASAVPVLAESVINAVKQPFGGKADYSWQDAAFRQLVDPAQNAVDYYALKPDEKMDLRSKIANGVGGLLQDLPAIIASGGLAEAPAAVAKNPGMMEFVGNALSTGFDAMRPIILKAAGEKADQVLESGGSPREAAVSALTAGMWAGINGAVPMSMQGSRAVRAVTGFPVGAATGEAGRVIQNAADPDNLQQPFDPANTVISGVQGSLLAAGMPGHAEAPADLHAAESARAAEAEGVPAQTPRVADVGRVLEAQSVDEAIEAANRAANPAPEGSIRSQMLAIRPLEEAPNVSREDGLRPAVAGAAGDGLAIPERSVEPGAGQPVEPAGRLAAEPASIGAEGEPVPPRAADAVEPAAKVAPQAAESALPPAKNAEAELANIQARRNESGTVTVTGDPAAVAALLRAHEIPFVPSTDGAVVGRTRAADAERVVQDFQPRVETVTTQDAAAPVSARGVEPSVDTPSNQPTPAVRIEPPIPAQPGKVVTVTTPEVRQAPKVEPIREAERAVAAIPDEPAFRRSGESQPDLRASVASIRDRLFNSPRASMRVSEVESALGPALKRLKVPHFIHDSIGAARESSGYADIPEGVKGMHFNGKLHLIAENLRSPLEAEAVFWHEVSHAGLSAMYGKSSRAYESALRELVAVNPEIRKAALSWMERYGKADFDARVKAGSTPERALLTTKMQSVDEALAEMASRNVSINGLPRFIARVQEFLRVIGLHRLANWLEGKTNAQALRMILNAREAVMESEPSGSANAGQLAPAFSKDRASFSRAADSDADLPEEVRAPYAGPGARMLQAAGELYSTLRNDLMMGVAPMSATNNKQAQAMAQKYANQTRWAQVQWGRLSRLIEKNFTPEERQRMWEAADEENVARIRERDEEGYTRPEGVGLARLSPKEREGIDTLHEYGQGLWNAARDAEMVEGDGLPFWTPRMLVTIGEDGDIGKLRSLGGGPKMATDGRGRNITTNSSNLKHRKHLTTEETEAAASSLAQEQGANGAKVVRDIMVMPLAMYRLERAIAGRRLINQLKDIGQASGEDLVRDGAAEGYITLPHPAFTTYRPRFTKNEEGKTVTVTDDEGNPVMDRVPLYIRKDFEGPLRAVMSTKDSSWYTGYMLLKSKAMSAIMVSPLIHNMVIWGKAIPASPVKMLTFQLYAKGHALARDNALMKEAVDNGMVPIGENHAQSIDVTDIAQNFKPLGDRWGDPNESWFTLSVEKLGNLLHEGAGTSTKAKLDAAGEFLHHTLLWKQIGALQMGIYADAKARYMAKGFGEEAAGIQAAHLANRYGGVVAKENQSEWARKIANVLLFSRSFNFTNLGTIKDSWGAMPTGLKALLSEKAPSEANRAEWQQRRKAWGVIALDIALGVMATSLMQDLVDSIKKDKSADDILKGYADRAKDMASNIAAHPLTPNSYNPYRLSSTWRNEPGKKDRVDMGAAVGERHEYMRMPTGKVAEDLIGWTTETLETFERKMAPIPKAVMEASLGHTTIGMPVADPNGSILKRIGEGVAHVMKAQLPWDDITRVYDWMQGHATELDKKKVMGTVTGFTFSQGHPGGPEAAVNQQASDRFEQSRRYTMQLVKDDLKRGDEDKARERMEEIGMTPREINRAIQQALEPRSGLSKQARQKFERRANDEEREEMDRQRAR